ncbi:hypothetical protein AB1339_16745 [Streptomyces cyaneofuscatus]|uniref:hypothetical protein n=1 Tax=Streptomyces cyaneofuscatus TaxID=66883 RepID=UPI00345D2AA0
MSAQPVPQKVCAKKEVRRDRGARLEKADVRLCVETDGKAMRVVEVSAWCYTATPISTWKKFPGGCSPESSVSEVKKGGQQVKGSGQFAYTGPGTYSFTLSVRFDETFHDGNLQEGFSAYGDSVFPLRFTAAQKAGAVLQGEIYRRSGVVKGSQAVVTNAGKQAARGTVLIVHPGNERTDRPSPALAAYRTALQQSPRDEPAVAQARKNVEEGGSDDAVFSTDQRCVGDVSGVLCDLGTVQPGGNTRVTFDGYISRDDALIAMEMPEVERCRVCRPEKGLTQR